jgi:hypothetical protein
MFVKNDKVSINYFNQGIDKIKLESATRKQTARAVLVLAPDNLLRLLLHERACRCVRRLFGSLSESCAAPVRLGVRDLWGVREMAK